MDPTAPLHVLLVDDDPRFLALTAQGLRESGIEVRTFVDGRGVAQALAESAPPVDLVLLDVMMPETTGWQILEDVRRGGSDVPIIFVTAREQVEERVRGLRMGADDYIIKPFAFAELLARIHAVVRRKGAVPRLTLGPLELEPRRRQVRHGAKRVDLSPKEFDLLRVLLEHPGRVLSRRELLAKAWEIERDPGTNVVEVHISRLRRKLGAFGSPTLRTIRGEGYSLTENGS